MSPSAEMDAAGAVAGREHGPAVVIVDADTARARRPELAAILIDSVEGGASIGFHHPLTPAKAGAFWDMMIADIEAGRRHLLAAEDGDRIVGVVMLALPAFENGFNRGDVQKLLVLRRHRRRGIAQALMARLETLAGEQGRGLLVLDSSTDTDGTHFYRRHGWHYVGDVPDYASLPDGRLHPTSIFYKRLTVAEPPVEGDTL